MQVGTVFAHSSTSVFPRTWQCAWYISVDVDD